MFFCASSGFLKIPQKENSFQHVFHANSVAVKDLQSSHNQNIFHFFSGVFVM